jgi:hypothetical protein
MTGRGGLVRTSQEAISAARPRAAARPNQLGIRDSFDVPDARSEAIVAAARASG